MNKSNRLIALLLTSCGLVSTVHPDKVTVKLLKTDQGTWDKQFAYFISTRISEKKSKISVGPLVIREATLEMPTKYSAEKFIRKDGKVTFDRESEKTILYVCTKLNVRAPETEPDLCKSLDLGYFAKFGSTDRVVGIDKNGVPSVMTQDQANDKIRLSGKPPMHAVKVKKVGNNTAAWTVKVIRSDNGVPAPDIVLSRITIKRSSSFKLDSLKVPTDREFFITVNDGTPQKFRNVAADAVLNIDDNGIVEIGGVTAAVLMAQEEELKKKKAEHDAKVAQAKQAKAREAEEKKLKAARDALRNKISRLVTQEIIAKRALARAESGSLDATDKIVIEKMLNTQEPVKKSLLDTLAQDPDNSATIERIKTTEQLSYGDYVRVKPLMLPALKMLREQELGDIQTQIGKLEKELQAMALPLAEATHIRFEQED